MASCRSPSLSAFKMRPGQILLEAQLPWSPVVSSPSDESHSRARRLLLSSADQACVPGLLNRLWCGTARNSRRVQGAKRAQRDAAPACLFPQGLSGGRTLHFKGPDAALHHGYPGSDTQQSPFSCTVTPTLSAAGGDVCRATPIPGFPRAWATVPWAWGQRRPTGIHGLLPFPPGSSHLQAILGKEVCVRKV